MPVPIEAFADFAQRIELMVLSDNLGHEAKATVG